MPEPRAAPWWRDWLSLLLVDKGQRRPLPPPAPRQPPPVPAPRTAAGRLGEIYAERERRYEPFTEAVRHTTSSPLQTAVGLAGGNIFGQIARETAAAGTVGVQALLPGQQEIQRKAAQMRARGIDPLTAAKVAYESSDLPIGVKGTLETLFDPLNLAPGVGFGGAVAKGATAVARPAVRAAAIAAKAPALAMTGALLADQGEALAKGIIAPLGAPLTPEARAQALVPALAPSPATAPSLPPTAPAQAAALPPVPPAPPAGGPGGAMAVSQPPESAGFTFVRPLRPLEDVMAEVSQRTDVAAQVVGRTGINPAVLRQGDVGRIVTAYERQSGAIEELVDGVVAAALDTHAERLTGRMGGVLPLDSEGFVRGAGKLWQDVFTKPDAFAVSGAGSPLRAYIEDWNAVIRQTEAMLQSAGLPRAQQLLEDGAFYVPRQVKGIRGIELRRPSNPNLARHYEEATEGFGRGVRYDADPRATLALHVRTAYRQIADDQLSRALAPIAVLPKALVPAPVAARAGAAARAFAQAKVALGRTVVHRGQEAVLGREATAALRGQLAETKPELLAALSVAQREFAVARSAYRRSMDAARRAEIGPGELFGQEEQEIPITQWRNKYFTRRDGELLAEVLGRGRRPSSPFATAVIRLANTRRFLSSVGDFAEPFVQGLPTLFRHPMIWSEHTLRHYQAFLDPTVQARFIKEHYDVIVAMARHGVPIGDPEFFAALRPGEGLSLGGLLRRLPGGAEAQSLLRLGGRQSFGRFQSSYNTGLTVLRVRLAEAARRALPDTAERMAYVRNMTGGLDSRALGVGPSQRAVEGFWLAFSPRLLRSTLALVGDALRPGTPRGREALSALGSLAAGAAGVYVLSGLALGKDWDQIKRGLNPLRGREFLSHSVNGQWIGVGGQVRAVIQLSARLTMALAPGGEKPEAIVASGIFDNPLVQAYYYRGAPGVDVVGGALEFAIGGNVVPFSKIDTVPDLLMHLFSGAAPFAVQGILEGDSLLGSAAGLVGFRTSPDRAVAQGSAYIPRRVERRKRRARVPVD